MATTAYRSEVHSSAPFRTRPAQPCHRSSMRSSCSFSHSSYIAASENQAKRGLLHFYEFRARKAFFFSFPQDSKPSDYTLNPPNRP
ncbi:hypothetical protein E1A91_D06G152100v1 [Gossypium mustelinum]|uniref:Uncharacterized protein n=1 Tax=Gossypium mustelinum TaxID=34275 RepID=A0A5D2UND2_GOSMU|nr:hypothetical protein E1A91_D06G152100v1 [Gossypium mustelinum]